ncbi:MAG: fumarate hydratase, class [Mycobacterium sp.]|nr:fumarate hydratase, class [Mycobacterium sp.]
MRPIVINNFLHSARILGDACEKLQTYCIDGVQLDNDQIAQYVHRSLMLVTALSPVVGYDKATAIGNDADRTGRTLRESALDSGAITAEDFDRIANPPPWSDPLGTVRTVGGLQCHVADAAFFVKHESLAE